MSVTRGNFLRSLGKSLPGMALGTTAAAAEQLLKKFAAVAGEPVEPPATPSPSIKPKPAPVFIRSAPAIGHQVALTFDDGPVSGVTNRILDSLQKHNVRATFFMIGKFIAEAPDLAKRVLAEGHEIGNHTYTHPNLTKLPESQVLEELRLTHDIISGTLNYKPRWFRPPYGELRANQAELVQQLDMRTVLWNIDPRDWSLPGEDAIVARVMEYAAAGSVILCHDREQTANCLEKLLGQLSERGLTSVTLSALMA